MVDFTMATKENFASFVDQKSGKVVFIDSFDNFEFDVLIGSFTESEYAGTIRTDSDKVLNEKLNLLYQQTA